MRPTQLFEMVRRNLRSQLHASGCEFGVVKIQHRRSRKTTIVVYTDRPDHFHFEPQLMGGVNGTLKVTMGYDQIWVCADGDITWKSVSQTSPKRKPLKVKVNVYGRDGKYELSILVPRGMAVAKLTEIVDTDSLFREEEAELPAMSMVAPIFETLMSQRPVDPAEAMEQSLADMLSDLLPPGVVVRVSRRKRQPSGIGSFLDSFFGRRPEGEGKQPSRAGATSDPSVMEVNGQTVIVAASYEKAAEIHRGLGLSGLVTFLPREKLPCLAGTKRCDSCHDRGRCGHEDMIRNLRSQKAHRGGVTSDPWDGIDALGALFGHPSFTAGRHPKGDGGQEDIELVAQNLCPGCPNRASCTDKPNLFRKRREAARATGKPAEPQPATVSEAADAAVNEAPKADAAADGQTSEAAAPSNGDGQAAGEAGTPAEEASSEAGEPTEASVQG